MSKELNLVSVVVICYNHSKFVVQCLESIVSQPYKNIELIIIDDCSKDNSVHRINEWIKIQGIKCNFIAHKENIGLCKTLNEAISLCTGKYIKTIASDDVLLENYLPSMVEALNQSSEESLFAFCDMNTIDENNIIIEDSFFKEILNFEDLEFTNPLNTFFKINYFTTPSCIYKKEFFEKIGPYDETIYFEDLDMWLRFFSLKNATFESVNKLGVSYRKIKSSMSGTITQKYVTAHLDIYLKHQKNNTLKKYCRKNIRNWTDKLYSFPFSTQNLKYYWYNLYLNKTFLDFKLLVVYLRDNVFSTNKE